MYYLNFLTHSMARTYIWIIQILDLLGKFFDAAVVFVMKFSTLQALDIVTMIAKRRDLQLKIFCIQGLYEVPDYPGGFVIEVAPHGRLHLFAAEARSEILAHILENSVQFIGVNIAKPKSMTFDRFVELKFGTYRYEYF